MKKYTKLASTLLASMFVVAGLSSCGGGSGSKDTSEIVYYSAGFNETWINTLANKFEQTHEGIKVHITASYSSEQIISQHLASRNNPDDLYIYSPKRLNFQQVTAGNQMQLQENLLI